MTYWNTVAEVNLLSTAVARQLQSSFALSWCPSMYFKEFIVVCALDEASILQKDHLGKYVKVAQLPEHKGLIRDVAWAPSMGRGYQLIATASKDGYVRIFKVVATDSFPQISDVDDDDHMSGRVGSSPLRVELVSQFDDHAGEVWSVSWNLTGTILSSAGDDGKLRFWKQSYSGEFQCMSVVTAEQRLEDMPMLE